MKIDHEFVLLPLGKARILELWVLNHRLDKSALGKATKGGMKLTWWVTPLPSALGSPISCFRTLGSFLLLTISSRTREWLPRHVQLCVVQMEIHVQW